MHSSEVIIIGAGPAGSTAAQRLAQAGVKVTLMERHTFPRDKACGDGVGARGLAVLDRSGVGEWASHFLSPEILRMSPPDGIELDVKPDTEQYCFGRTIPRLNLDEMLVRTAQKHGAHLIENIQVDMVHRDTHGKIVVEAGDAHLTTEILILADGSHAPITRRLGLNRLKPDLYAIRQYYGGDTDSSKRIEFHFQEWIVPGYTWIFPMNDGCANVGTGTFTYRLKKEHADLKGFLGHFLADQREKAGRLAHAKAISGIKGHPLRTQLGKSSTHASRILVIGDAAGLVNPLSGEGLASGMESGEMAARHVQRALEKGDFSAEHFSKYTQNLRATFAPDWRAARLLRQVLKVPQLLNYIFRRMRQDPERALLFGYLLLNHIPQRQFLKPSLLLQLFK